MRSEAAPVGWLTVRYVYDDLVRAPDATAAELAGIHAQRIAQLGLSGVPRA